MTGASCRQTAFCLVEIQRKCAKNEKNPIVFDRGTGSIDVLGDREQHVDRRAVLVARAERALFADLRSMGAADQRDDRERTANCTRTTLASPVRM